MDNKPGANGNLSAEMVLKAPADGHTLWIGTQSMMTINPAAFATLRWKPSDFTPIIKSVEAPLVLVTHPSVAANDFAGLAKRIQPTRPHTPLSALERRPTFSVSSSTSGWMLPWSMFLTKARLHR